ncbi:DDE Tnp4 domain-containing protein [Trichonephila clavipes]|nr:DDE Tnp4 domain-containing protein [Trichonephila clavipes]
MLKFLDNQAQLSTKDANETHLVASIHWVVLAANGHLKNWRALNKIIPNNQIPYIRDFVKFVCAIVNAFHPARLNNIEDYNIRSGIGHIIHTLNGIVSAMLGLELLAAVHMLHLHFGTWGTDTKAKTPNLGYADTLLDTAAEWSSKNSASKNEMEI